MKLSACLKVATQLLFVSAITGLSFLSLQAAIVAICATIMVVLYGQLGSLIEVSFGPLKAKLERDVTEAERLTTRLKALAAVQGRAAIAASAHTGRFSSGSDWIFVSAKRVEASLRELGVSEPQIQEARTELVDLTLRDAGRITMGSNYIPQNTSETCQQEWRELRASNAILDPDAIKAWLKKWQFYRSDHATVLDDMRWMIANRDIRDSAMYLRAHKAIEDHGLFSPPPVDPVAPLPV